jgi:hypothetical protein
VTVRGMMDWGTRDVQQIEVGSWESDVDSSRTASTGPECQRDQADQQ